MSSIHEFKNFITLLINQYYKQYLPTPQFPNAIPSFFMPFFIDSPLFLLFPASPPSFPLPTIIIDSQMQKYKIVKSIGDGSFGVVFKAMDPNNQIVAIKKMKSKYKTWQDCNVLREIKCLKKLQHPNIVKLREVILANSQLYLVFDYLQCNLYQVYTRAQESNRTLTENQIKAIFFKIATGLAHLHKFGYFHRDLKPENILCHNNDIKVCDFGLAREIRSRPPYTQYVSTRWYRAPELLLHGAYSSPVDIFALASIVVELYLMAPVFPGQNEIETMNKIVEILGTPTRAQWPEGYKMASTINYNFPEKKKKELSDIIPNASLEAVDLLQSMFSYSSRKRPSASDILKHEYFNSLHAVDAQTTDVKSQTKFSFYQKNIIEIPKNLPVEDNKEMEMRKSLIKFGTSFGSSFHLNKEERADRTAEKKKEKQLEFQALLENNKEEKVSIAKRKHSKQPRHDQISKKFDEMQEILMQLQKKQEKKEYQDSGSKLQKTEPSNQNDFKMPVFTFGGIGVNSFSTMGSLKNVKSPIFLKTKPGQGK